MTEPQQLPIPPLVGTGGVLSTRPETGADGTPLLVLRAQNGVVAVDCPMTVENVDALIKGLRDARGRMNGGLVVAKGLGALNGRG